MSIQKESLQKLKRNIRLAEGASGIRREILLLEAANEMFDHHAIPETEWRNIARRDSDAWLRQMKRLLNSLEYSSASAEAYSGELSGLSNEANEIREKLEGLEEKTEELENEVLRLRRSLDAREKGIDELERELSVLRDLKELIPIREEMETVFGNQARHSGANGNVLRGIRIENENLSERQKRIETLLSEQDRLLKESVLESERRWREIRKRIRAS